MMKWLSLAIGLMIVRVSHCQVTELSDAPVKGSYLYYGQPAFEDNSFLLAEAITQPKGVLQFISNAYFDNIRGGDFVYSFTNQIPITHLRHQLNYTLFYNVLKQPGGNGGGFGDINVGYRYMASGKKAWAMVVPGVTLILPTGKAASGTGSGGFGIGFNLAVTKRLSRRLITNFNTDFTFISKADRYDVTGTGGQVLTYEQDISHFNFGASAIWFQTRKFHWMLEGVTYYLSGIGSDGAVTRSNQVTLNPGFRFAIDHGRTQIVPGLSAPIVFMDGKYDRVGLFFYLSFEPEYLPFTKAKTR
jgi:hypothetical protein